MLGGFLAFERFFVKRRVRLRLFENVYITFIAFNKTVVNHLNGKNIALQVSKMKIHLVFNALVWYNIIGIYRLEDKMTQEIQKIMDERFGHDTSVSVATEQDGIPSVRIVNGYYENGSFYVVTYALSNKMKQIEKNPVAAVCGEWFTAHGIGENLGYIRDARNTEIFAKLKAAFSSWYDNGHINENDPNTCILKIKLTDAILFSNGTKYELEFN